MKSYDLIKNKKIFVLSSFGHAGIDWIHSLFDNHSQILIIPSLSFFRNLNRLDLNTKKKISINKKIKIFCKILSSQSKKDSMRYKLNLKNFDHFYKEIKKNYFYFKDLGFEKSLFYSVHIFFLKQFKKKIEKIKIIICHEHAPWNCKKYLKFFDVKMITVIRDPRAAIAGSLKAYENNNSTDFINNLEFIFCFLFHSIKNYNFYFNKKSYLVKNEDFNKNLELEMRKISSWLEIAFQKSLLRKTFLGSDWKGESSYISKSDLTSPVSNTYYSLSNVKKRWKDYLTKSEVKTIEVLFSDVIKIGKYDNNFDYTIYGKLKVYLGFLFNRNFERYKFVTKDNYFKKVVKRFLLITLKEKYTKLFKLL
jgi:hypothetical protein